MMIKNESRILQRSLQSSLPYIDGICILDTGSTDNTIEIAESIITTTKSERPDFIGKVYHCPFKNFGFNRSKSFECAVELLTDNKWDLSDTYGMLLDADMVLKMNSKERVLNVLKKYDAMMIYQEDGNYKYYNIRFIKMSCPWECSGVTHEYWRCGNQDTETRHTAVLENDIVWIDDISDGGCKDDKLERDIRMLETALSTDVDPENTGRYHFYLAQSYMGIGNYKKSIEHYTKHIEIGSFLESIWFATFMIERSHLMLDEMEKAEIMCQHAYELLPGRSEPLYELAKYYFIKGPEFNAKAEEYVEKGIDIPYPKENLMYIDSMVYNFGFKLLKFKLMQLQNKGTKELVDYYNEMCKTAKIHKKDVSLDECLFSMAEKVQIKTSMKVTPIIHNMRFIVCRVKDNDYRILINNRNGTHSRYHSNADFSDISLEATSHRNVVCMYSKNESLFYVVKEQEEYNFYVCDYMGEHAVSQRKDQDSVQTLSQYSLGADMVKDTPILNAFKGVRYVYESDNYYVLMELRTELATVFIIVMCDSITGIVNKYSKPFYFETGVDEYCMAFARHEDGNFVIFYMVGNEIKISIISTLFC